jgi:hypothetical protein
MILKKDAIRRFVFAQKMQSGHINGLTYDFLYGMANELEDKDSLLLLGAGAKSNQPSSFAATALPTGASWRRTRGHLLPDPPPLESGAEAPSVPAAPAAEEKPA